MDRLDPLSDRLLQHPATPDAPVARTEDLVDKRLGDRVTRPHVLAEQFRDLGGRAQVEAGDALDRPAQALDAWAGEGLFVTEVGGPRRRRRDYLVAELSRHWDAPFLEGGEAT